MEREKVLGFLNLNLTQKADRTVGNIGLIMDIAFSVFILLFGFLDEPAFFKNEKWPCILILLSCVILFICFRRERNPVRCEVIYPFVIYGITCVKLFYGYFVFSQIEFETEGLSRFSWGHLVILIMALVGIIYVLFKHYGAYNILKRHSSDETVKILRNKKKPSTDTTMMLFAVVVSVSGAIVLANGGSAICLWALACCWLLICMAPISKVVIAIRYKAARWFEE